MNNVIALTEKKHEALVSSLILAENLGITHGAVLKTIDSYMATFQELNPIRFEIAKGELLPQGGRAKATRYALLNEDQSFLLLSFSRNTKRVVELKLNLVQAFGRFRREQQTTEDYLPFYHDLHDNVKALSEIAHQNGSQVKENLLHMNFNKLINKAFCLDAGQRPNLPPKLRAKVTAANVIAGDIVQRCVAAGLDHKTTYQKVKQAVFALAEPVIGLYQSSAQNQAFPIADTKNPEL
jgi:phage regulator Rha-like protein